MAIFMPFIGLTFNGIHSSELGLTRVSDGTRQNSVFVPQFSDTSFEVPGADGSKFCQTVYQKRDIPVSFAFDHLTTAQLSDIKRLWNDKKNHDLIFDEEPYKAYSARVTSNATFKYIEFVEDGQLIYKGEISMTFTSYTPYARGIIKSLEESNDPYKSMWAEASGLPDITPTWRGNDITINNVGDVDMPFIMVFDIEQNPNITILLDTTRRLLVLSNVTPLPKVRWDDDGVDTLVVIDTKNELVEGGHMGIHNEIIRSGRIYNSFITYGDFFNIPLGRHELTTSGTCNKFEYNYLYL